MEGDVCLSLWQCGSLKALHNLFIDLGGVFRRDALGLEIFEIACPAALALAADPVASLIDTAFVGHLGAVDLAAVGVAIAVFNQVSKIAIFPLVSVTTSLVAEEDAVCSSSLEHLEEPELEIARQDNTETDQLFPKPGLSQDSNSSIGCGSEMMQEKRHIPSATSALVVGCILGLVQAFVLICVAKPVLNFMGVSSDSPMFISAHRYLVLRSLGAPAVLLSLATQGIFRGMKDTRTPLYATVVGDAANIALDPIFIIIFGLGVSGAAIAHVLSQYLISILLLWKLKERVELLPPSIKNLQFDRFLGSGFLLLMRVIAATFVVTLAASLAARHGSNSMAAFHVCLQIWMASSLIADGLAVAAQAILASDFARKDFNKARATASRVLHIAVVLGLILCAILLIGLPVASKLFTTDLFVLQLIGVGIPFVAATQPINVLAFVFDGVYYGGSDFAYAAYSMMLVVIVSIPCLLVLSSTNAFIGIWISLTIFMSLRTIAGFLRIGTGMGPWNFLRN